MIKLSQLKTYWLFMVTPFLYWCLLGFGFLTTLVLHKFSAVYLPLSALLLWRLSKGGVFEVLKSECSLTPVRLFFALWAWAGVTLLWTLNFANGSGTWVKIVGMGFFSLLLFAVIGTLTRQHLKKITTATAIFFLLIIVFLIVEKMMNHLVSYFLIRKEIITWALLYSLYKPLATYFALMFFPVILVIFRGNRNMNYILSALLFFVSLYMIKWTGSYSAFVGLLLGGFVFVLTLIKPHGVSQILKYGSFVFTFTFPFLPSFVFSNIHDLLSCIARELLSFYHRLYIWHFTSHKFLDHPFRGWGLGSSKDFPGGTEEFLQGYHVFPLHPHNNPLQVFLELGIPGGILYAFFIFSLFKLIEKTFQRGVSLAAANGLAVLTLVICNMSHSAWHIWILSWIIICFGLLFVAHRLTQVTNEELKPAAIDH